MGLRNIDIYFEDWELAIISENQKKREIALTKWKSKQPQFIAVEMSNAEIVKAISNLEIMVIDGMIVTEGGIDKYKEIKGKIYKKVTNPKIKGEKIISWD